MKQTVLADIIKSDGCSYAPDFNLYECCAEHDWYYRTGNTHRFIADLTLSYCIYKKGRRIISLLYFIAVRWKGKRFYVADGDNS